MNKYEKEINLHTGYVSKHLANLQEANRKGLTDESNTATREIYKEMSLIRALVNYLRKGGENSDV